MLKRRTTPVKAGERTRQTHTELPDARLGLVCVTTGEDVRFRTITRTRFLSLSPESQEARLTELYADNLNRLYGALTFCQAHHIQLYRATSGLFPMNDHPVGTRVLEALSPRMAGIGLAAERLGIRIVLHPDQYVVLNSLSPGVVQQSIDILGQHARIFDWLGLPRSTWSAFILHGGKASRPSELVATIKTLPEAIRHRLVLENDEHAYSADDILDICRSAQVPMVFDPHHHVIKEKLSTYEHPSILRLVEESRKTWPVPGWQMLHISNGRESFGDRRHSDFITAMPSALLRVSWLEVEAKGKEQAIQDLRVRIPGLR